MRNISFQEFKEIFDFLSSYSNLKKEHRDAIDYLVERLGKLKKYEDKYGNIDNEASPNNEASLGEK